MSWNATVMSAWVARLLNIAGNEFKASTTWIERFMKQNIHSLRRASLCQKVPSDFTDKVIAFHGHVIGTRQEKLYIFTHIRTLIKLQYSSTCLETLQLSRKVHQLFSLECQAYIITLNRFISSLWIGYLFTDITWKSPLKACLPNILCIIFAPSLFDVKIGKKCVKIT
jgi:hypothetical protein